MKDDSNKTDKELEKTSKKQYVKPSLERMNDRHPAVAVGMPPVPGAPASASSSPIAPGATVF